MTITDSIIVAPLAGKGSEITAAHFGMNIVLGYERFGSQPWEKFDEIQSAVGSHSVRFPGGTMSEQLFDYAAPNATSAVAANGNILQLITPDAFLDYCAATQTKATINLPVAQLLTEGRIGVRDFDVSKAGLVRDYVHHLLEKAGPEGIETFELGNEYATFMLASEYGKVASAVGLIVHQEIEKYFNAHPGHDATKPEVAVQVWGQSAGGTFSLTDLASRNHTVMAQFDAEELSAITAVTDHFYYWEGKNPGEENYHTYTNIANSIGYSLSMMQEWSSLTGHNLDTIYSEWNVNYRDSANYGLQQIPVMLEMFTSFVKGGVDQLDFWSTMYNATSLGDYHGELQAAGVLFQIMSQDLVGTKATEVPVHSDNFDIHAFSGHGHAVVFVSSLIDQGMRVKMDLSAYMDRYEITSARLIQVDGTTADGAYKGVTGLQPWEEADAAIKLTPADIAALVASGQMAQYLNAHETLVLEFDLAKFTMGSIRADRMQGLSGDDRIDSLASSDAIDGMAGNDTLFGGSGNDSISGGDGQDRILGGVGRDVLYGGADNDVIDGKANGDFIYGGDGDDLIAGGDSADRLWGGAGADGFVFRTADRGSDVINDFSAAEGDYLVFDGATPVTRDAFQVEIRAVHGLGDEATPDLVIRLGAEGPIIWQLKDAGALEALQLLDANTGQMITLL